MYPEMVVLAVVAFYVRGVRFVAIALRLHSLRRFCFVLVRLSVCGGGLNSPRPTRTTEPPHHTTTPPDHQAEQAALAFAAAAAAAGPTRYKHKHKHEPDETPRVQSVTSLWPEQASLLNGAVAAMAAAAVERIKGRQGAGAGILMTVSTWCWKTASQQLSRLEAAMV